MLKDWIIKHVVLHDLKTRKYIPHRPWSLGGILVTRPGSIPVLVNLSQATIVRFAFAHFSGAFRRLRFKSRVAIIWVPIPQARFHPDVDARLDFNEVDGAFFSSS